MEEELVGLEERSSDIRNRQAVLINELEKVNIAGSTGSRSTVEWVSSRLDVSRMVASDLVYAARWMKKHRRFQRRLADGYITFDRALATTRLAVAGADETTLTHSESLDLTGSAGGPQYSVPSTAPKAATDYSTTTPAVTISAMARAPSPGERFTGRIPSASTIVENPRRAASRAVSFTQ